MRSHDEPRKQGKIIDSFREVRKKFEVVGGGGGGGVNDTGSLHKKGKKGRD